MSIQVHDFGQQDGVQTYRIAGVREDLYRVLEECQELKAEFDIAPTISYVRNGLWTMLLKIKVPTKMDEWGDWGNWVD